MRVELLLELSGLSRQESLVIQACATHSYPAGEEDDEPSYEDFELDEEEATALNCLEEELGLLRLSPHVIQLQLAANAAFGRAKGRKGKGKGRGIPEGTYNPRPRGKGAKKKTPPNPPLDRCTSCTDFSYQGSSVNYVRKTCRDCGHVSQEKREHVYTVDPAVCSHETTDHRGSSRSTSRTFCRMCGIFVDEVPQEFHRERKAVSEKLLEATEMALPTVQSITADDATADLDPEAVLQLL
eukprot:s470_g33.t1